MVRTIGWPGKEYGDVFADLSAEQCQAALVKAGESRRHRSEVLDRVKSGEISFADLLSQAGTDAVVGKTKVLTALRSVPGIGAVKAGELMDSASIAGNRKLAGLGSRQREALLSAIQ
ncbi:MAG: integration host factor [Pseudonocardiaceae bacterium]|nr:integration host factor [Pseudonocardiaceae bacterium]